MFLTVPAFLIQCSEGWQDFWSHFIGAHLPSTSLILGRKAVLLLSHGTHSVRSAFLPRICPFWFSDREQAIPRPSVSLSAWRRSDPDDSITWHSWGFPQGFWVQARRGSDKGSKSRTSGRQGSPRPAPSLLGGSFCCVWRWQSLSVTIQWDGSSFLSPEVAGPP